MNVIETNLPGVLLIEPKIFGDDRGFFYESYNQARYSMAGINLPFIQDNVSYSKRGVLRGLHFQNPNPQGKLVSVLHGEVFDVAVDIRRGSPFFGKWAGVRLNAENKRQLWIPPNYAHGFLVMSEDVLFCYKVTDVYQQAADQSIAWNDPDLGIDWPLSIAPILSAKDSQALRLKDFQPEKLPVYR